ncbi:hypothetical protein AGABI1DRAFT_95975, partial [Agaricus bisporus var. burnettii JB137-S8]
EGDELDGKDVVWSDEGESSHDEVESIDEDEDITLTPETAESTGNTQLEEDTGDDLRAPRSRAQRRAKRNIVLSDESELSEGEEGGQNQTTPSRWSPTPPLSPNMDARRRIVSSEDLESSDNEARRRPVPRFTPLRWFPTSSPSMDVDMMDTEDTVKVKVTKRDVTMSSPEEPSDQSDVKQDGVAPPSPLAKSTEGFNAERDTISPFPPVEPSKKRGAEQEVIEISDDDKSKAIEIPGSPVPKTDKPSKKSKGKGKAKEKAQKEIPGSPVPKTNKQSKKSKGKGKAKETAQKAADIENRKVFWEEWSRKGRMGEASNPIDLTDDD